MDDYVDMDSSDPHLDAVALVAASARNDSRTVGALLAAMNFDALAEVSIVLMLMVQAGVRAQGMSVEEFLKEMAEMAARKSMEDPS